MPYYTRHIFSWLIDFSLKVGWEHCCRRMKHFLRDIDMIVAKTEKLQHVKQFAVCMPWRLKEGVVLIGRKQLKSTKDPRKVKRITRFPWSTTTTEKRHLKGSLSLWTPYEGGKKRGKKPGDAFNNVSDLSSTVSYGSVLKTHVWSLHRCGPLGKIKLQF